MSTSHRRSCDRCHLQKVRCLRNPQDDSCTRCVKAGATCNYSLKQKSGRPLTRSLPHSGLRSWAPGQDEVSAAAFVSYLPSEPPHSMLSTTAVEMLEMDMDDIGIPNSISSDAGATTNMAFVDTLADWDLGFLSAEKSSSSLSSSSSDLCHPQESVAVRTDSGSAGSSESAAAMGGGGGGGGGGGSHWYAGDDRRSTTQQAGSHLETYSEKLTVLSSRILRSARLVACPSSPTLTVTSPHVEGLFEATRTLITVVDGLGQYYATSKAGPPKRGSIPEQSSAGSGMGPYEWDSTADRGVVFLVLVCQQRLLGVFEAMCLSIRERLHSAPAVGFVPDPSLSPSLNHRAAPVGAQSPAKEVGTRTRTRTRTRKRTLRTTTATIWQPSLVPALHDGDTPSLAQSAMVLQLLSHLLNRLDRAFDPLAEDAVAGSPSKRSRSATLADSDEDASHHDPGHVGPESVDERQQRLSKAGEVVQEDFTTRPLTRRASTPPPPARGSRGMLHVARGLLDGVKTQHTSLRRDIEGLQRYIEQSRGL